VREDEVRSLAVVLGRTDAVATGGLDHRQAFEPIVHLRVALQEVVGRLFCFVESPRVEEVDRAIRRLVEAIVLRYDLHRGGGAGCRHATLVSPALIFFFATFVVIRSPFGDTAMFVA